MKGVYMEIDRRLFAPEEGTCWIEMLSVLLMKCAKLDLFFVFDTKNIYASLKRIQNNSYLLYCCS